MEVHHRQILYRLIRARIFAKTEVRVSVKNVSAVQDSLEKLVKMVIIIKQKRLTLFLMVPFCYIEKGVCTEPCLNLGRFIGPDLCDCVYGFTGRRCEAGMLRKNKSKINMK